MSKIKLLLEVVNDMRSLADSIQAVCDAMTEGDPAPGAKAATEQEPVKEPDIPTTQYYFLNLKSFIVLLLVKCQMSLTFYP